MFVSFRDLYAITSPYEKLDVMSVCLYRFANLFQFLHIICFCQPDFPASRVRDGLPLSTGCVLIF